MKKTKNQLVKMMNDVEGKVAVPILMYILGVPGFFCILAWLFFFKGK